MAAYLAEGAFDKRLSDGEVNEMECINDLAKYGLQYKKNDEQKKTDLVDVHEVYPNIEVKLCKTKYPAMCCGEPLYIFIQRTKDSLKGYFDSGPWDTIKHDPNAFAKFSLVVLPRVVAVVDVRNALSKELGLDARLD